MQVLCSYFHECSGTRKDAVELMKRVHAHDEVAFRSLVEQYQSPIFSFTYAATGDINEADELAQKVFVRAYRDSGSGDTSIPVSIWLYRMAFEECVLQSRIHTLKKIAKAVQNAFARRKPKSAEVAPCAGSRGQQPAILDDLRVLSPKARILLLLREVAHQSVSELTQITGADANVIRKQLFAARRKLLKTVQRNQPRRIQPIDA